MAFSNHEQQELRKYLLGQISDDQQLQNIEQRWLTDDEFFEELEIVEDELIDEYLEATLETRPLFEGHFLKSPNRLAKLRFARALAHQTPAPVPAHTSWHERLQLAWSNQNWVLRAATVSALAVAIAALIWLAIPPSPKTFATLALTVSSSERSQGGEATKLRLPLQADALRLQLRLPEGAPRAPSYRVELIHADGKSESLIPVQQNDQAVTVELNSNQLSRGQYALNLFALRADKTEERIRGSFLLTVE